MESPPEIYGTKGTVYLLLVRTVTTVRWSVVGIGLGLYDAAWPALRAAFESVQLAALFCQEPRARDLWLKASLVSTSTGNRRKLQDQISSKARVAYEHLDSARRDTRKDVRDFLWNEACANMHSSLEGVAERFGFDPHEFFPDGFLGYLDKFEGDFDKASAMARCTNRYQSKKRSKLTEQQDEVYEVQLCAKQSGLLFNQSWCALIVAYTALELVNGQFEIADRQYHKTYDEWQESLQRLHDRLDTSE